METKFNYYEIIGYVIPGAIFIWAFTILSRIFGSSLDFIFQNNLQSIVFILSLSYMVGHLIQGLSKKYEKYLIKIWGGLPSVRFLRKEDEFYTSEFKKNLKEAIIKYFSLDAYSNECHPSILDKRYQDMFYQCYSFVDQKCLTEQHKSFNATYGFFRGIAIISIIFFL